MVNTKRKWKCESVYAVNLRRIPSFLILETAIRNLNLSDSLRSSMYSIPCSHIGFNYPPWKFRKGEPHRIRGMSKSAMLPIIETKKGLKRVAPFKTVKISSPKRLLAMSRFHRQRSQAAFPLAFQTSPASPPALSSADRRGCSHCPVRSCHPPGAPQL